MVCNARVLNYSHYPFVCGQAAFPCKQCDPGGSIFGGVCGCVCACLLVSPHLPYWTPSPKVDFLCEKDRGPKSVILCCHVTEGCDMLRLLGSDVGLAGASCSSRAAPVPSVPTRREQPVGWRMGERVPGLPLF